MLNCGEETENCGLVKFLDSRIEETEQKLKSLKKKREEIFENLKLKKEYLEKDIDYNLNNDEAQEAYLKNRKLRISMNSDYGRNYTIASKDSTEEIVQKHFSLK
jgi:hypothetical protein